MFDEVPVGKCSLCGGLVTMPCAWWSVVPPTPTCQKCGAVEDVAARLPTVPMKPARRPRCEPSAPRDPNCDNPDGRH